MRQCWPENGGHAGEELWGARDLFGQWVFDENGGPGGSLEWWKGQVWRHGSLAGAPEWPGEPSAWKFPYRCHPVRGQQGILLSPSGPGGSKQLFQVRHVRNKPNNLIRGLLYFWGWNCRSPRSANWVLNSTNLEFLTPFSSLKVGGLNKAGAKLWICQSSDTSTQHVRWRHAKKQRMAGRQVGEKIVL